MTTYNCARELEGHCLQVGDHIMFSDVGTFKVCNNEMGWYLLGCGSSVSNDKVFTYLYGNGDSAYKCIKKLGDYPTVEGGGFPYLETAEDLTEVVSKLFLEVERKRLKEFDFMVYTPKGTIASLSRDVVFKLCKNQVEQGNVFDLEIFENDFTANRIVGGMDWSISFEGGRYWISVLTTEAKTQPISPTKIAPFGWEEMEAKSSSLATLSARKTQKPRLKTL